ncbi:glycoside hydrolase superfamily, partial [Bisporella sp. PMI_857]
HVHPDKHEKRDAVVETIVDTVYAEATGVAPSSAASVAPSSTPVVEVAASVATTPQVQVEVAAASSAAQVTAASSSSSSSSSGNGFGFSYSPYLANGNCKSQAEVDSDFATIGDGYSLVRIYGVDCNQTATVLSAAKAKGLKLFAGIYDITDLTGAVETIVAAANGDWSSFDTVSVGNEIVNGGGSAATVIAAIGTVRTLLTAAGYTGKVGTVDTLVAARANPGLCDASDVCTVNCHPFFDGNVAADGAGDFLETQIPTLRAVLSDQSQEIVITETGWPWKGDTNGLAVPSTANQEAAISSIRSKFASSPSSVILFTVFNDLWKTNNAAQFNAEQYWGFLGYAPSG